MPVSAELQLQRMRLGTKVRDFGRVGKEKKKKIDPQPITIHARTRRSDAVWLRFVGSGWGQVSALNTVGLIYKEAEIRPWQQLAALPTRCTGTGLAEQPC